MKNFVHSIHEWLNEFTKILGGGGGGINERKHQEL